MANTTFSGPVRSENGFKNIIKSSTTGSLTNEITMSTYVATVTVANGATTGKESAIGIPSNFIPMGVMVAVTTAAANAVNLVDIGTDADTDGFVDGISAEDIGKFPDTNLAESLQRITGVAIERDRGEGSKITVRGFGPDFNIVSFNGRQMPTNGGRSFDFGNIASEGISAVEVYKSGRANAVSYTHLTLPTKRIV